jgi:hypothetical protein
MIGDKAPRGKLLDNCSDKFQLMLVTQILIIIRRWNRRNWRAIDENICTSG